MRRPVLIILTVIALAITVPLSVLATVWTGLGARHWSGVRFTAVAWSGYSNYVDFPAPYSSNLGAIGDLTSANPEELAGFRYDGELVAIAATDTGEQLVRDGLRDYPYPWRVERVRFSRAQLVRAQNSMPDDNIMRAKPPLVVKMSVNYPATCVEVIAARLSHDLFKQLDGFEDTACVVYSPREPTIAPAAHPLESSAGNKSTRETWWDPATLPGTYWVLLTGFPWHIAALVLLTAALWLLPARRRAATVTPTSE